MSEVVSPDSAATVAPPVVITPISSTSVHEGEAARFLCRVRGDSEEQQGKNNHEQFSIIPTNVEFVELFHCHSLTDVKISWFQQEKEIKQSDFFRMSQFDDCCQLEISRVYREDEGQYTCVATNSAGKASCSASLTLDGEFYE